MQDTANNELKGIMVQLIAHNDTLNTITNEDGIFVFKNVGSAEFILSLNSMGKVIFNRKYLFNDTKPRLILPPVIIRPPLQQLGEVTIKGKVGPKYFSDTTEYWADDYIVRDYAKLADLLNHLEGVSVDKYGNLTHNGIDVKRAQFNGVRYFGGDVKEIIKDLPANIIERIQIIDDYGEQSRTTGIKNGTPGKVLNVVSKPGKSVGNMFELTVQSDFTKRDNSRAAAKRVNGKKQLEASANASREPAGVNPGDPVGSINMFEDNNGNAAAALDGKIRKRQAEFSYHDIINKNWSFETGYNFNNLESWNQKINKELEFSDNGNISKQHQGRSETDYSDHDARGSIVSRKENQLFKIDMDFNWSTESTELVSSTFQKGLHELNHDQQVRSTNNRFKHQIHAQYNKILPSGVSFTTSIRSLFNKNLRERHINQEFIFSNSGQEQDSLIQQKFNYDDWQQYYFANFTVSIPIKHGWKFAITASTNYRVHEKEQQVHNILNTTPEILHSNASYIFKTHEYLYSAYLTGNIGKSGILDIKIDQVNNELTGFSRENDKVKRIYRRIFPGLHYRYTKGTRMNMSIRYNATLSAPSLLQVIPIPNIENPLDKYYGNPNLKPEVTHTIAVQYFRYLVKPGITLSFNNLLSYIHNKVVQKTNINYDTLGLLHRTVSFQNTNNYYRWMLRYNAAKSFHNNNYSIKYEGSALFENSLFLNNGEAFRSHSWNREQKLTLQANIVKWMDADISIQYVNYRNVLLNAHFPITNMNRYDGNLSAKIYLGNTWVFHNNLTLDYLNSRDKIINNNAFIYNFSIEKRIFKQKNALIGFLVRDIFKQNHFLNRSFSPGGYNDNQTNKNSRYFLLQFSWTPQKWTAGKNNGKSRRRDGSFIH